MGLQEGAAPFSLMISDDDDDDYDDDKCCRK